MFSAKNYCVRLLPIMCCFLLAPFIVAGVIFASSTERDILQLNGFNPTRIEVFRSDYGIALEKNGTDWYMTTPIEDRADQEMAGELIERLKNLTIADILPADADLDFGMDQPQARVKLHGQNGDIKELLIGNHRSPVSLYVQPVGSPSVYAISNVRLARLGMSAANFLDRTLIEIDPDEVTSFEVRYRPITIEDDEQEEIVHIVERRRDVWMTGTGTVAFDVLPFLRSIRMIQAADRITEIDETNVAFYPNDGTAQATVSLSSGDKIVLDIGGESEDGLYQYFRLAGREGVYALPRFQAGLIVNSATNINDSLINIDFDMVSQVKLRTGPGTNQREVIYRKNNSGQWELNRSIAFNTAPLFEAIGSIEAKSPADDSLPSEQYGFDLHRDALNIEIEFIDKNILDLRAGAPTPDGTGVYVKSNEKTGVFVGALSGITNVIQASDGVRTKLFPASFDAVREVRIFEVSRSGDVAEIHIKHGDDGWKSTTRDVPENAVQSLVAALDGLGADEIPDLPDDPEQLGFYPANESKRIQVVFSDGTERTLDIGRSVSVGSGWFATNNFYIAISDLDDITFVREQSLRGVTNAMNALK